MEVKEFIEKNLENMKADLSCLVKYNSVFAEDEEPFGKENRKVLDEAIKLMQEKGLKTTNMDYYCGYGEAGEGKELIGILAHLDIVPVGEGWDTDPFTVTEKDGFLYGRGVSDDKGAAVASMYALKYLIDEKYPFKRRVRLILGCNEETGSMCIRHYVKNDEPITYGFTPDGDFPGIYAEKGMIGGKIIGHNSKIIDIEGGEASNVVCKKVTCKVPLNSFDETKLDEYFNKLNIKYEISKDDVITLVVYGVAAHASTPDLGINAINHLFEGLYNANFNDSFVTFFHNNFGLTTHGEILGYLEVSDDISDYLSITFYAGTYAGKPLKDCSMELQDTYVRLDNAIASIIENTEKKIGKENALFVITSTGTADTDNSDLSQYRIPTGNFYINRTASLLNMMLVALYGPGQYVEAYSGLQIYLNHQLLKDKQLSLSQVLSRCQELLLQSSGVKDVYTSERLLLGAWTPGISKIRNSYNPKCSGDILIQIASGWNLINEDTGEKQPIRECYIPFPIIYYGFDNKAQIIETQITTDYIAPTLSKAMRIRAPNGCSIGN